MNASHSIRCWIRVLSVSISILLGLCLVGCREHNQLPPASPATVTDTRPSMTPEELCKEIGSLIPWGLTPDYPEEGWARLVHVGRMIQQLPPATVSTALSEHIESCGRQGLGRLDCETKPFLLLRVVFDIPPEAELPPFCIWLMWDENREGTTSLHSRGPVVVWQNGKPRLLYGCRGSEGRSYAAAGEYEYLRHKFPFRDLSSFAATRPSVRVGDR